MPTQLAQMGTVAKTQARAQQATQPATGFQEQQSKDESLKTQRVKETEKTADSKIDPDEDRRRERRRRRRRKLQQRRPAGRFTTDSENDPKTAEEDEDLGSLIDMRA
ncbi:hypothetical protein CSB20_09220 [bacterium DOLZORAL124_64_63]|nr:MAG: hypothetical protein CSB20_09220 [bacterium DOLZORAL124_64_63]